MSLDFELVDENGQVVFNDNITHNLNKMANKACIYEVLQRPEENGYEIAHDCIHVLTTGLLELISNQEEYEKLNSPNGWGMYENFVPFVTRVLTACHRYPQATIRVDR